MDRDEEAVLFLGQRRLLIVLTVILSLGGLGVVAYRAAPVGDSLLLSTDDDERLTPELAAELRAAIGAHHDGPLGAPEQGTPPLFEFALRNETGRDIFIQVTGLAGQGYWALLRDGRRIQAEHDCAVCVCGQPCSVCGRQLATVKRIATGMLHTWAWSGELWTPSHGPQGACEQVSPLGPGQLTLTAVYGFSIEADSRLGANDVFIADTRTVSAEFAYPEGRKLELLAR